MGLLLLFNQPTSGSAPSAVEWSWMKVTVGTVDMTGYLALEEQTAQLPVRSEIGRATLSFIDDGSMPSIGMWGTVEISAGTATPGTPVWGGYVTRVTSEPISLSGGVKRKTTLDAQDYSVLLTTNEPITETYGGGNHDALILDHAIVSDLVQTYLAPFYDAGSISSANPVQCDYIQFSNETLRGALNKLNERSDKEFGVSAAKKFFWRPPNSAGTVGHQLHDAPDFDTKFPMRTKPYHDQDGVEQRNAVKVVGGWTESAIQTETFATNGILYEFQVAYFPQTIISVDLGGTPQTVGVYLVDDPADFDVLVWYDQRKFIYQLAPTAGKTLTIMYRYPIRVEETLTDAASIAALGLTLYGPTIEDTSISSTLVAEGIGSAYLARATAVLERGQVTTTWVGTAGPYLPGQVIDVTADALAWSNKLLEIQSVTMRFAARGTNCAVFWDLDLGTPLTMGRSLGETFRDNPTALKPSNWAPLIIA